ncbi:MAG: chemotaxis protein CheB [Pseudobdellovibrionaceae bacterium]
MVKLTKYEQTILYQLIEKVTGGHQQGNSQKQIFVSNVESLMRESGKNFKEYLDLIGKDTAEFSKFISSVTIHTTSWFREPDHFEMLEQHIRERAKAGQTSFKVWSAASSTGQEVFSIALLFEFIKKDFSQLEYEILGTDIDVVSIEKANRAVYPISELKQIPQKYLFWILQGTNKAQNFFTIDPEVRKFCSFNVENLDSENFDAAICDFDFVFCRNVLIYFHPTKVKSIIEKILARLKPDGVLTLAHSEALVEKFYGLKPLGRAVYLKDLISNADEKKTALVVDDNADLRFLLKSILVDGGFEVLEAGSSEEASEIIKKNRVDVISLDIHMPGKDGISWLRDFRANGYGTPVMIVSGANPNEAKLVYGAFERGAQEFFEKEFLPKNLKRYVKTAQALSEQKVDDEVIFIPSPGLDGLMESFTPEIIVIGASTGGPDTIWRLVANIPKPCPPIFIVQHTSPFYARHFAETLSNRSGLSVSGMIDGQVIQRDQIYLSHGDYHIEIEKNEKGLVLTHSVADREHGHRPSVDRLFKSVAKLNVKTLAILLTGMGEDGAQGMAEIYGRGNSFNIAQSKDSCVVYGMPREAIKLKSVHWVADVESIRKQIEKCIVNYQRTAKAA